MAYTPTNRAFRFSHNGTQYALDIQADGIVYTEPGVHLFFLAPDGWNSAYAEMQPAIYVRQEDIDMAGGLVAFCKMLVERVNQALRALWQTELPPAAAPHEQVADFLRAHLSVTVVNGAPQLMLDP